MSNFARAVEALNDVDVLYGALVSNEDYVTVLQGRGLLAPDLPEPAQALAEETWEYAAQAKRGESWETCINSETHLEEWWENKDDAEYEAGRLQEQGRKTRIVRRMVSPQEVCE